jgi:glycyl-tRNA synthetase
MSGQKLDYFEAEGNKRYVPHVLEPTFGVERSVLAALISAYHEEEVKGETRVVMKFPKKIAPIHIAILPLSKKDELIVPAKKIFDDLKGKFVCEYDETQSIGKRYRRQDEVGTPFCVTVDFETSNDNAVTVRDRDSMEQERIKIEELEGYLKGKFEE